jgi:phosphoheptose isomerase
MIFVSMAIAGIEQATSQQLKTIGLLGRSGGALVKACDIAIVIPSTNMAWIQDRASAAQEI